GSGSGSRTTSGAPPRARSTSPPPSPATRTRWSPGWPPSATPAPACPADTAYTVLRGKRTRGSILLLGGRPGAAAGILDPPGTRGPRTGSHEETPMSTRPVLLMVEHDPG